MTMFQMFRNGSVLIAIVYYMIPLDDKKTNAVSPSYLQVLHLWIQPTMYQKYSREKNFQKVLKSKI